MLFRSRPCFLSGAWPLYLAALCPPVSIPASACPKQRPRREKTPPAGGCQGVVLCLTKFFTRNVCYCGFFNGLLTFSHLKAQAGGNRQPKHSHSETTRHPDHFHLTPLHYFTSKIKKALRVTESYSPSLPGRSAFMARTPQSPGAVILIWATPWTASEA